ncbi:MAG: hypothetical protein A3A98_03445 [Candidatus Staskawiczbacteria bacterium RIFCSPLOWO2_01_FULL_40_39]|uniref:Rod shape-determining protein MreD n=1 Tax=Candidatus Staskawiczbacteria bacterium RIFCSPHIGHO2_01_FULL_39_25 TaxID=1802202 RepID=A0A1G2HQ57_9BACT|nr:MAG: hypothetical protein A2730_02720 [Candidatus Staskawiczbacteria bacterium RIFCSPHIGHO2_01_FULL_39_25]OGZ72868.1 MAG: hypothetical protein A3A98_03445 [Candidatus Staskawiczbacteria bacterium RIFCSPLOWO2_01_FULL_40_39]OGZ75207.1 MAG: hypothetical protein A3I87_00845 [Candidatus Staskawiczbacteria bacterium RIFCSPLOWO2_02_FULL_39_8]
MWLRYIIITLLFFIAALMQASFVPYFGIKGIMPNVVFALFFLLIFLKKPYAYYYQQSNYLLYNSLLSYEGLFIVIVAGFFLDIFSSSYFGLSLLSLLMVYFIVKTLVYFLREQQNRYMVFYFLLIFPCAFFVHTIFLQSFSGPITFNSILLFEFLYTLVVACTVFYGYKGYIELIKQDRQLRLFD